MSAPSFTAPGQTIAANYDGGGIQQVVAFTVTGGTLWPANVTAATVPIVSARPNVAGASFWYKGSLAQTVRTAILNTAPPGPVPTGTPQSSSSASFAYTASQTVIVLTTTAPSVDQHTVEVDTLSGNGQTTQVTSDAIMSYPAAFSGNLALSSFTWNDGLAPGIETATNDTTTYGTGNGTIDVLPETAGATWSNTAAHGEVEASGDGRTATVASNPDGSYAMTMTGPPSGSVVLESIIEKSDGSGTLTQPCGDYCNVERVFGERHLDVRAAHLDLTNDQLPGRIVLCDAAAGAGRRTAVVSVSAGALE